MADYRKLLAGQAAHELVLGIYEVSARWPVAERYGLTAQLRRAALSVPLNIVEGSRRLGSREFRRYLDIAWGSLGEVEYILELAGAVGLLGEDDRARLRQLAARTGRLTHGLLRSQAKS